MLNTPASIRLVQGRGEVALCALFVFPSLSAYLSIRASVCLSLAPSLTCWGMGTGVPRPEGLPLDSPPVRALLCFASGLGHGRALSLSLFLSCSGHKLYTSGLGYIMLYRY